MTAVGSTREGGRGTIVSIGGLLLPTLLLLAWPAVSQAQVSQAQAVDEALSGEELFIDRLGCWNCHGMIGGGGAGPAIAKTELSLRTFAMYLRLPSGEMPRVSPRLASDADLATLYRWLDGFEAQENPVPIELSLEESGVAGGPRSEVTLTAQPVDGNLDADPPAADLPDVGALRYRITFQTLVPWVRGKTPVANQRVEYQLAGREDWAAFTTDEHGEAVLGVDQGFGLAVAREGEPAVVRFRFVLAEGRHALVVEAIDATDPAAPVVLGIGTVILRGPEPTAYRPVENHFKLAEGRWWG